MTYAILVNAAVWGEPSNGWTNTNIFIGATSGSQTVLVGKLYLANTLSGYIETWQTLTFIVPVGWYYRIDQTGAGSAGQGVTSVMETEMR